MGKKRVMVVVDQKSHSKDAMLWALTHVADEGDLLTLLQVVSSSNKLSHSSFLIKSLGHLCKASRPQVEVEGVVIQGPRLHTVLSQVKKLEVSVLVVPHTKPSLLTLTCFSGLGRTQEFAEQCINNADCWTIAVRKQTNGIGGYLINSRWHKNFWLLA